MSEGRRRLRNHRRNNGNGLERDVASALASARRRTRSPLLIGEAELYCENTRCPIRVITTEIKEDNGRTPARLTCPSCGMVLAIHHVWTFDEAKVEHDADARRSVNIQLYEARERRRDPDAIVPIPIGILVDDALPGRAAL